MTDGSLTTTLAVASAKRKIPWRGPTHKLSSNDNVILPGLRCVGTKKKKKIACFSKLLSLKEVTKGMTLRTSCKHGSPGFIRMAQYLVGTEVPALGSSSAVMGPMCSLQSSLGPSVSSAGKLVLGWKGVQGKGPGGTPESGPPLQFARAQG